MPSTRRHSYDLNFKLKIVAEAEAVDNNREIAREYGISESMVRKWRNQQHVLFSGELKMTAKRASMGVFNSGHDSFFECLPHFVGARLGICFWRQSFQARAFDNEIVQVLWHQQCSRWNWRFDEDDLVWDDEEEEEAEDEEEPIDNEFETDSSAEDDE